jgi:hypothetical protein
MRRIFLLLFVLTAGCGGASGNGGLVGGERRMAGVFTAFTEGSQFQECPGREPWQCFSDESPPCALDAVGEAGATLGAALGKAGQGYAAFKVELVGKRREGGLYGHLGAYGCEIRSSRILSITPADALPPEYLAGKG